MEIQIKYKCMVIYFLHLCTIYMPISLLGWIKHVQIIIIFVLAWFMLQWEWIGPTQLQKRGYHMSYNGWETRYKWEMTN